MTKTMLLFAGVLALAGAPRAAADGKPPATVLLIRHGEKPPDTEMSVHLSADGKRRADALPKLFEKSESRPDPFPKPAFLFATENSKNSHRPVETVEPLATALNLKLHAPFKNDDFAKLATHVLTDPKHAGKTVLICWHHGTIPQLAKALGATDAPANWKGDVFDRVWRLDYADGKVTFHNLPQKLLPTDSKK